MVADFSAPEFAVMRSYQGDLIMGYGEMYSHHRAPDSGTAFYINDYSLSDSRPWKTFSHMGVIEVPKLPDSDVLVEWEGIEPECFATIFNEIQDLIALEQMVKSVPVVTQKGTFKQGGPLGLLANMFKHSEGLYPYAWKGKEGGFCGLSPEVFFGVRKSRLQTMALAGTAKVSDADVLAWDKKEIQEHEFVACLLYTSDAADD